MPKDRIDDLQLHIETLWASTGRTAAVPIMRRPQDDGSPHVEMRGDLYDIVITERGSENKRIAGLTLNDAARWFVFVMAVGHGQKEELENRRVPDHAPLLASGLKDHGYSRWNWMAPAIEIMAKISPEFGVWAEDYYGQVLKLYPLEAYEKRNSRYPLPVE